MEDRVSPREFRREAAAMARQSPEYRTGWMFLLFAAGMTLLCSVFVYLFTTLDQDGITVEATVTKMRWYQGHEPQIWVEYQAPGAEPSSHHFDDISPELYQSLSVGGTLPLEVVPGFLVGHPDNSGNSALIYLFYLIPLIAALIGIAARRGARRKAEQRLRIMQDGVLVEARVDRIHREEEGTGWMLAYRYRGADGRVRKGESGPHKRRDLEGWQPDDPIDVLADPEDIAQTLWVDAPDLRTGSRSVSLTYESD